MSSIPRILYFAENFARAGCFKLNTMEVLPSPTKVSFQNPFQDSNVRVFVRARPLCEKEVVEDCMECVSYSADEHEVVLGKDRRFTFDRVFIPAANQGDIYYFCVKPLVDSCLFGYNATIIAYGQTGSGKTYTMGSANSDEDIGILPRAICQLYENIDNQRKHSNFDVKCSFVEIYNEEIKDLLHPETPSKSIFIREDSNGDIILAGVMEERVLTFDGMMRCLERGSSYRTTGSTLMNQHSSRSHAIFTMIIEKHSLRNGDKKDDLSAKFHLVDLAGSERAKRTGAFGMRFKESVAINRGLLALGNVISALGDERKRDQHVPYRQSKLTRILQDSLGGNSKTCMIACISTADVNLEETVNTLRYANRARNIRNKPVINHHPHAAELKHLQFELKASKALVKKLQEESFKLSSKNNQCMAKLDKAVYHIYALVEVLPIWESSKAVTSTSKTYLMNMANNILCNMKTDDGLESSTLCDANIGVVDINGIPHTVGSVMDKELVKKHCSSTCESQQQSKDRQQSEVYKAIQVVDSSTQITQDINDSLYEHLQIIHVLEDRLEASEHDVKEKTQALMEAKDDLMRDEHIFAKKIKENQALKKLLRDLKKENEDLIKLTKKDATTILQLSQEIIATEAKFAVEGNKEFHEKKNMYDDVNKSFAQAVGTHVMEACDGLELRDNECHEGQESSPFYLLTSSKHCSDFEDRLMVLHQTHINQVQDLLRHVESFPIMPAEARSGGTSSSLPFGSDPLEGSIGEAFSKNAKLVQKSYKLSNNEYHKQVKHELIIKLQAIITTWYTEKQEIEAIAQAEHEARKAQAEDILKQHENLRKDYYALKEELENTKSLMHKAGLGIRLSVRDVRKLSHGDVDLRTSTSLPPSRGKVEVESFPPVGLADPKHMQNLNILNNMQTNTLFV